MGTIKKALLIVDDTSADLILEDGSYAFIWISEGKVVKCDLHQGRIERALVQGDVINDVANEKCDKQYFQEWEQTIIDNKVINDVIEWLAVGTSLSDYNLLTVAVDKCDFNNEVNTFLNLK